MDLDDDSLFVILDHLDTVELLKLCKNPQFVSVIRMVLIQRFNKTPIVIKDPEVRNFHPTSGVFEFNDIIELNGRIHIELFSTAETVLRIFGYLIKTIEIRPIRRWSEENVNQIVELIEMHCSETVKTISFHDLDANIFDKLTVPFKAVETVGLMSGSNNSKLISSEFGFNSIFPAIRYLYTDTYNVLDTSRMDTTDYLMPHLTHIHRVLGKGFEYYFDGTQFGNIIKNNPQITSIVLASCKPESLEFLSLHAPNLENLEFQYFIDDDYDYTQIRFDKLKKLEISAYTMPRPFACDKLEEIVVTSSPPFQDVLNFIANRVNLKKIYLNMCLDNGQISSLASIELNVSQAEFKFENNIRAENVIQFIRNSPHLTMLKIMVYAYEDQMRLRNDISELLPELDDHWTTDLSDFIYIIVSKKSN